MRRAPQQSRFTRIPNRFIDTWLPHLAPTEAVIYLFIARKCWGWNKYSDKIAISQIVEGTNIPRRSITRALARLKSLELLIITGTPKQIQTYEPTARSYDDWMKSRATVAHESVAVGARLAPGWLSTKEKRNNTLEIVR